MLFINEITTRKLSALVISDSHFSNKPVKIVFFAKRGLEILK